MSKYLGLDSSTQSLSATIIDTDTGSIVAEDSVNYDAHFAETYGVDNGVLNLGGGQMHSPPLMWADALDLLLTGLRDRGLLGQVRAVAGSGQQHGTVYLNETAAPVLGSLQASASLSEQLKGCFSRATAPIWMDTSTGAQCGQIEEGVGGRDALLRLTGNTAFERFSGPQIRKFWQDDPEGYERTACVCLVSSFVASLLAGRLVPVDAGDASGTNLMDIRARQWAPAALEATAPGLASRLLPVAASHQVVGPISPYFVAKYGFAADCQILPFSGDNPCSLIGMGLVTPGQVALSLGTSDTLFACMAEARTSATGEGALFASPDGANYMALICFLNGSLAREAVRDQYGLDWDGFSAALAGTTPGNGGGLMLPYFDAEIVPRVERAGAVRHQLDESDAAANVRAVIEAQALSSRLHSEWMGVPIQSLSVTGGASANSGILQVFADVHGCPVQRFQTPNAAALGAALRACHGETLARAGSADWQQTVEPFTRPESGSTIEPDASHAGTYEALLEEYRQLEIRHLG